MNTKIKRLIPTIFIILFVLYSASSAILNVSGAEKNTTYIINLTNIKTATPSDATPSTATPSDYPEKPIKHKEIHYEDYEEQTEPDITIIEVDFDNNKKVGTITANYDHDTNIYTGNAIDRDGNIIQRHITPDKQRTTLPKTGDNINLYIGLLIASFTGIITLNIIDRRKRK